MSDRGGRLRLWPQLIVRLGALPCEAMEALRSPELSQRLQAYLASRDALRVQVDELSELLHGAIGGMAHARVRGAALRVRRNVYNRKRPSAADLAQCRGGLRPDLVAAIDQVLADLDAAGAARAELLTLAIEGGAHAREHLLVLASSPGVANGILLSSPTLFGQLVVAGRPANAKGGEARRGQIHRGLLRYVTRAAMKATPFSTFCSIAPGRTVPIESDAEGHAVTMHPRRDTDHAPSLVRLNKLIFGPMWDALKQLPEVRAALLLELNPTLERRNSHVAFVASVLGGETFQRIEANAALALVIELVGAKRTLHRDLVGILHSSEDIESTRDEAAAYVDALIRLGVLRIVSPVASQDAQWHAQLAAFLSDIPHDAARRAAVLLRQLDVVVQAYGRATTLERRAALDEVRRCLDEVFGILGCKAPAKSLVLLYEDCGSDSEARLPHCPGVDRARVAMEALIERRAPVSAPRAEMATLRHFVDRQYAGRASVALLELFEAYYRGHLKAHLEREERITKGRPTDEDKKYDVSNPFGLPLIQEIRRHNLECAEAVRRAWRSDPAADEIKLAPSDWPNAPAALSGHVELPESTGIFAQIVTGPNGQVERVVVPNAQTFVGFGRYFSRFLPLLPSRYTSDLRERNAQALDVLAEIAGDANFNANFHPQVLADIIQYPMGDNDQEPGGVLCTQLVVSRGHDPWGLVLSDTRSGRRVIPVDMGFLNPKKRPALFRFLSIFGPTGGGAFRLPSRKEAIEETAALEGVVYRPRVVFDDVVVLARRRWAVSAGAFPSRAPSEDASAYYVRVNEWRHDHGIPSQVYVRIDPKLRGAPAAERDGDPPTHGDDEPSLVETDGKDEEESGGRPLEDGETREQGEPVRRSRDYLKPQFIDFANPLMTDLFGRLPVNLDGFIAYLEERYPDERRSMKAGGRAYASELILQLDRA